MHKEITSQDIGKCVFLTVVLLATAFAINTTSGIAYLFSCVYFESLTLLSILLIIDSCVIPAMVEESAKRVAVLFHKSIMLFMFPVGLSLAEIFITYSGEPMANSINRVIFHSLTMAVHYVGVDSDNKRFRQATFWLAVFMHFTGNLNYVMMQP